MRMTRGRGWLLIVLWVCSGVGCRRSSASQSLGAPSSSFVLPALSVAASSRAPRAGNEVRSWVVSGTARALHEAKLGPKTSGVLAAIYVDEGDPVKKGQVLFRLDASTVAMGIAQAQAALTSATVARDAAQTELERTRALFERGSIAPAVYDQVKARYDGASAAVEQARAALNTARKMTADTAVVSPINGVVAGRYANVGDTVTMMPPTTVLLVQDVSSLEIRAKVPETWLKRIRPGQPVRVRFPALDLERTVPIERINPAVDPVTRTVELVALVPNPDRSLKAGMLVEVDLGSAQSPAGTAPASSSRGVEP